MPSKPPVSDIVKQLRALAEKATPGKLIEYEESYAEDGCYGTENGCPGHATGMADTWGADDGVRLCNEPGEMLVENAAYLAALDRATMLQLLDVIDAAQACVDSVKSEWCGRVADEFGGHEDDWATWWDDSKAVALFTALRRLKEQA